MLSPKEKKEMLEDGLSRKRRKEFLAVRQQRPKSSRKLDDYISFLMDVQKIMPFQHKRIITPSGKNTL